MKDDVETVHARPNINDFGSDYIYFIEENSPLTLLSYSNLTKSSQLSTSLKDMFKLFANNTFCMHIKCGLPKQKAVKFLF